MVGEGEEGGEFGVVESVLDSVLDSERVDVVEKVAVVSSETWLLDDIFVENKIAVRQFERWCL